MTHNISAYRFAVQTGIDHDLSPDLRLVMLSVAFSTDAATGVSASTEAMRQQTGYAKAEFDRLLAALLGAGLITRDGDGFRLVGYPGGGP